MKRKISIGFKIGVTTLAIVLAGNTMFLIAASNSIRQESEENFRSRARQFEQVFQNQVTSLDTALRMSIESILENQEVLKAFTSQNRELLDESIGDFYSDRLKPEFAIAQFQFHLPPATSFYRAHNTGKFGDDLSSFRKTVIQANSERTIVSGIEVGRGGLGYRVVYPISDGDNHFGTVEFGSEIDPALKAAEKLTDMKYAVGIRTSVFEAANRFDTLDTDVILGDLIYYTSSAENWGVFAKSLDPDFKDAQIDLNGEPYRITNIPIYDYSNTEIGQISLLANQAERQALLVQRIRAQVFMILGIAAIIVLTLLVALAFMVLRPIKNMNRQFIEISSGNGDLTSKIRTRSSDEISELGGSFNTFTEKLRALMIGVKDIIHRLEGIKSELTTSAEESSSAIEQISANLSSVDDQIVVLDNNIAENVTAIEQVTENISSMDKQIVNQSAMVEESTSAITQMISSLGNVNSIALAKRVTTQALTDVAKEGKKKISTTADNFDSVVAQIEEIQQFASTINDIAAQTNLLSMNAAIEAAHAGDTGRGFAVVAEEIRKLADSASRSSRVITDKITGITEAVVGTSMNVNLTTDVFDRISREVIDTVNAFTEIEHAVAELNTGGEQILQSTYQINDITTNIRNGSADIKTGTKVMLESSAQIKDVSTRVTSGMTESTTGAQEVVRAMNSLMELAQGLSGIVGELTSSCGRFKTE